MSAKFLVTVIAVSLFVGGAHSRARSGAMTGMATAGSGHGNASGSMGASGGSTTQGHQDHN